MKNEFKSTFAENIFKHKYAITQSQTWKDKARSIVDVVCGSGTNQRQTPILSKEERELLVKAISEFKFLPGGRYIYYAGRTARFWNNCFLLKGEDDSREEWGALANRAFSCLMVGGGIGVDYSVFRPGGRLLKRTGGIACLTADTVVYKDRKKSGTENTITIDRLFYLQTYFPDKFAQIKIRSLDEDSGVFYRNKLIGVVCNGIADVYELVTESGYTIKATANHRFMDDSRAYKHLAEFSVGDLIAVNGVYAPVPVDPSSRYKRYPCAECGSGVSRQDALCVSCREKRPCPQCGGKRNRKAAVCFSCASQNQQKGDALDTTARQRRECLAARKDCCELCYTTVGPFEVHHKDKNPLNNHSDNLLNLCVMCHNAVHKVERKFGDPYSHRYVSFDPIKSITLVGREMVFDLQMEGPNHNFVANGFVSHNSGPIPLMRSINEIGRNVCQGGSRRSAIYGSLNWQHEDANDFISAKDWHNMPIGKNGYTVWDAKSDDFNFNAPLDMTNISLNYDDQWLSKINSGELPEMYLKNIRQALMTGEPGMSFNFGDKKNETLRNACCELTSEDDSDVCNLGSINIGSIESMEEFKSIIAVASKFLICGTVRGQLPYEKVHDVRSKNRRIGLGLMGIHEWLLKRNYRYEFNQELHDWFAAYRDESESSANEHCDRLYLNRPKGYRAIAPTGTIAILASTTSGIEPLFAVAYKRRYLVNSTQWRHEFVVDAVAEVLVKEGINPDVIETSADLANDPERRIKFQYDAQQYVDHAISSTINLPEWGSDGNNEDKVVGFAKTLAKYAHGLRGFTCYPDGSRGGQPITTVPYSEAIQNSGLIFEENSSCKDGVCGI